MNAAIVSLRLTPDQTALMQPILAQQREGNIHAVLGLVSSSFEPDVGGSVAKLDLAWLPKKTAQKIVELIRKTKGDRGE